MSEEYEVVCEDACGVIATVEWEELARQAKVTHESAYGDDLMGGSYGPHEEPPTVVVREVDDE